MQVLRLGDGRIQDSQRLAHQAGLQPHVRIADVAFDFVLRHQGRDRIDDDDIDRIRFHQHLGDLHCLFAARGWLTNSSFDIHTDSFGPRRVQGVFGVDKRGHAADFLGVGDGVQSERGFAARFRAIDFDDAAAGDTLAAEGDVQPDGARGDAADLGNRGRAQGHNGPFAEFFLDLGQRVFQFLALIGHVRIQKRGISVAPAARATQNTGRMFIVNNCYLILLIGRAQCRQREFSAIWAASSIGAAEMSAQSRLRHHSLAPGIRTSGPLLRRPVRR